MSIRARKSDYCNDWHVEQEFPCINGLRCWFVVATTEEADEGSIGYTDGAFGSAEYRARKIVAALEHVIDINAESVARMLLYRWDNVAANGFLDVGASPVPSASRGTEA